MQFSVLVLFTPAFPLSALFALINNVAEIRCDAIKVNFEHTVCHNLRIPIRHCDLNNVLFRKRLNLSEYGQVFWSFWENCRLLLMWVDFFCAILKAFSKGFLIAFTSEFVPAMKWHVSTGSFHGQAILILIYFTNYKTFLATLIIPIQYFRQGICLSFLRKSWMSRLISTNQLIHRRLFPIIAGNV